MHQRFLTPTDPIGPSTFGFAPGRSMPDPGLARYPAGPDRTPQGLPYSDQLARQSFGAHPLTTWRGMQPNFNDPSIIRAASMYYIAAVTVAAGARSYGIASLISAGFEYGVPVPNGKTFKLWYICGFMEASAVAGSRTFECGLYQPASATYTQIATLAGVTANVRSSFDATATNYNTPLATIAGSTTEHIALFYGIVAGGAAGSSGNGQTVWMNYTIE